MEFNSGLRIVGSRATEKIAIPSEILALSEGKPFALRVKARTMTEDEFINNHGSGTLRKNKRLGFHYKKQYIHERVAFDFGYGFECIHETYVNWGQPMTEGDSHPITEAGWFADRYQFFAFPGDEFETKHLEISVANETVKGVGIIIRKTSAPYIPEGNVVLALITKENPVTHLYEPAVNPY